MATAARWDMASWRNEARTFTLIVRGVDLTGVSVRQQVRDAPDTPGDPIIALETVADASVEGLHLVDVTVEEGLPVSTIVGRYAQATMRDKLPYGAELGQDYRLCHAIQIEGVTRVYGDWWARATPMDSDSAATSGDPAYSRSGGAPAVESTATLTFASEEVIELVIDGAVEIGALAGRAEEAVAASGVARAQAEAAAAQAAADTAYSRAALGGIGADSEVRTASYGVVLPVAQDSTGGTGNVRLAAGHALQRAGIPDRLKIQMRTAGDLQIAVMRPGSTAGSYAPVVLQTVTLAAGVNVLQPLFAMKIGDVLAVRQVTNGGGVEMTPGVGLTASRSLAIGTEFTPNASPSVPAVAVEFDYEEVTDTVPARLDALRGELRAQLPVVVGIRDLGTATAWADATVIDAPGLTPVLRALPTVPPSNGTPVDNQRFADESTIVPTPNVEVPAFLNSSTSWGTPPQQVAGVGVRLPTGAWTGGNEVEAACLAFTDGTTDTAKSSIAWNTGTLSADRRSVTFGEARILVTDSLATSKLVNPCMGYRPQDETTVLIVSRDARGDVPNLKFYELARRGGQWTKGIGGAAYAVGGTDAGAREIQGIIDPAWTRAYMCPQRIITDADGTLYAPGWAVVGLSYRIWLLKRAIGDAEWTRFWTIGEGEAGVPNSNRVQGEQSVEFAEDGTLLVIDRRTVVGGIGARAWWKVSKAGAIVDAGMYVGLADAAIGAGMCRLTGYGDGQPSRLLLVGPRTSEGNGQADIGFGASISFDEGASWLPPVSFDADRRIFRRSLLGTALAAPTFARNFSGNSCAIPIGGGHALALVERRGPTGSGTFGSYTAIAARPLSTASGLRLPTRAENLL